MGTHGGKRQGAGRKSIKDEVTIKELISPYRDKTIKVVIDILENPKGKDADRLNAAKLLLAYDFGTPKQSIDHTTAGESFNTVDLKKYTDEELRLIAELQRKGGVSK